MALRAMYKGFKKVLAPLIINRPGELAIDQDTLNTELNTVFFPRSEQAVLGAKNLFNPDAISNMGQFTYSDGEFKNNATDARANLSFNIQGRKNGTYVKSLLGIDCTATGKYTGVFTISDNDDINQLYIGHSGTTLDIKFILPFTSKGSFRVSFNATGIDPSVVNGIVIKELMFLEPTDTDYTYAPYAMTNRELTDAVSTLNGSASDQKTAINAIITAATGAADFAAFKTAMGAITPVTRSAAPAETREVIEEEPVTVKKSTRKKSTAKADTEKEGE